MTTQDYYNIEADENGWRELPNGNKFKLGVHCIIGDGAYIGDGAKIGDGAYIGKGVNIGNNAYTCYNVAIGNGAYIGNKVVIGNWVKIGNKVTIGKYASIGDGVYIGNGARIHNYAKIDDGATIDDDVSVSNNDKTTYLVTVINSAADYLEHKLFNSLIEAEQCAKGFGSHCTIEIWTRVSSNLIQKFNYLG